jgi:hypothetical protein
VSCAVAVTGQGLYLHGDNLIELTPRHQHVIPPGMGYSLMNQKSIGFQQNSLLRRPAFSLPLHLPLHGCANRRVHFVDRPQ